MPPERAVEIPVARRPERHARALAVDDQAGGDALHASGRRARADAPERDVRHLVAHETIEDAATLLGFDELHVEITPVVDRVVDRLARDLVEDHPLHRHVGLEHLEQVPRDRFTLAVFVGGEVELARVLQRRLELGDHVLLVVGHHVDRREVVVDVDPESPHFGLGDALRRVLRAPGQVADVTDAGHHRVAVGPEKARDRLRLRSGFDDHEGLGHDGYRFLPCAPGPELGFGGVDERFSLVPRRADAAHRGGGSLIASVAAVSTRHIVDLA